MKQISILLGIVITLTASSQQATPVKDLITVNSVKPKPGQKMAFEAAYKLHIAKFHKTEEKINVYEILSGEYAGYYHLVQAGRSLEDFEKTRSDAAAHALDLDKNFFPLLEDTRNATYRFMDSLSLRSDVVAENFVVSVNHLKQGLVIADYRREAARTVKIQKKLKTPFAENFSLSVFEQLWDGSDQVVVNIRNLKDGFKSLQAGFYGTATPGTPSFRDEYVKEHGHTAWDDRVKLLDGAIIKTEQHINRFRKDLSSQ
ncbi:MAG TPA: hypothetical protein VFH08_06455 [Chitinophagaceae bacterium]|nr:hypothetical protein [Chitinophagaceae bacterium]